MAKPKRPPAQREGHLARLAELYLTGTKQADIAEELGVSQPQISYDLKELQSRWADAALRDLDQAKGEELAKIDELERVYWQRWERSQKPSRSKSVTKEKIVIDEENKLHRGAKAAGVEGQDGEIIKTVTTTAGRDGSATWLEGIQWCIERRCKLLGLDKPTEIKHSGNILAQYVNVDFDKL